MPYASRVCEDCDQFIQGQNFARHKAHNSMRLTKEGNSIIEPEILGTKMLKSTSSNASADYIRDATLCMLRRTSEINVPALSRYLSTHFPDIPNSWCNAVVISTFTAAQKVAATYAEIAFGSESDDRTALAKKAMSRWLHGLSAVEPGRPHKVLAQTTAPSVMEEVYSPSTNFLVDRHVPVPNDSASHQHQLEIDLSESKANGTGISFDGPASAMDTVRFGKADEADLACDCEPEDLMIAAATNPTHDDTNDEKNTTLVDITPQSLSKPPTDGQSDKINMPFVNVPAPQEVAELDASFTDDVEPDDVLSELDIQPKGSDVNDLNDVESDEIPSELKESESDGNVPSGVGPELDVGNCTFDALLESV